MPRTIAPQTSEPSLRSRSVRRGVSRATVGVAALVLVVSGSLSACGNALVKQRDDTRPEPNASTEGVRSVYPTGAPPTPAAPVVPQKSGAGQSEGTGR